MTARTLYPRSLWLFSVLGVPLGITFAALALVLFTDVGTLPFDRGDLWWLLGLIPLSGALFVYGAARRKRGLERFASSSLAPVLAASMSPGRQTLRAALLVLAVGLIIAAMIGPRWGIFMEKQKVQGIDIVVALDVSRSMLARDVAPNRLERAKREIRQQLTERAVFGGTNRLALLTFAGSTSLKVPMTTDHLTFRTRLEQLQIGSAPRGGTAIGEAIRAGIDLFARSPEGATKVLLLLTDGEDHEGAPEDAAKEAKDAGILVYTVGVGDPSRTVGAEVPIADAPDAKTLIHDGQIVFSKLDVTGLRAIAEAGGGAFAAVQDLYQLVNLLASKKKTELTVEERLRHKPQYQWFVALALLMLGLENTISDRRTAAMAMQRVWQQESTE